jgi:protease-4
MSGKRSFTKSLFLGIWNGLNFGRRLLLNTLFLIIIIAVVIGISTSGSQTPKVAKNSALILDLTGNLVIQETWVDPSEVLISQVTGQGQDNPEVLLRDLINVIDNAGKDKRIDAIVLELGGFGGGGMDIGKLKEVGEALQAFKSSGKPIYAISDYYSRAQYYLASHADNVYLHPMGSLLMEGFSSNGLYFADALEKFKVSFNIFKVGTFKSAVEPYLRNDMSPEAKLARLAWLDVLWKMFKTDVAGARGFDEGNFDETFAELLSKFAEVDGDTAQYALANNWVDGLRTRAQFRTEMVALLGADEKDETFNQVSYGSYLKMLKPAFSVANKGSGDKVAVIVAKGTILTGKQDPGTIGGDSTAMLLRKARKDSTVKAVVLQVDSPGGSAFASEVIRQEIDLLKAAGKPIIASMSSVAASGGYWISMSTDRIFAEPSTITGSIGIYAMAPTFEKAFNYLGVSSDGVSTNELVGMSIDRPLAPGYMSFLQMGIEHGYKQFISLVAEGRGMTLEEVDKIAQGRVWVGTQALELGLVDELGGLEEAVTYAAKMAELEDFTKVYIERQLTDDERMWANLLRNASSIMSGLNIRYTPSPLMQLSKEVEQQTAFLTTLNDPRSTYVLCLECTLAN